MKSKFKRKLSFADAINEAQVQAMKLDKLFTAIQNSLQQLKTEGLWKD